MTAPHAPPTAITGHVLDAGAPFVARSPDGAELVVLRVWVCDAPGCEAVHVDAAEVTDVETSAHVHALLVLELDSDPPTLTPEDDAAHALLARAPWLSTWAATEAELLRERVARLRGQRDAGPFDLGRLPAWSPGRLVRYHELFPEAFDSMLRAAGSTWILLDAYCPDPACPGDEIALELHGAAGVERFVATLEAGRLQNASPRGQSLWKSIRADKRLTKKLAARRRAVRHVGDLVVATAYESARLRALRPDGARPHAAGGYLHAGATVDTIARLFRALERFDQAGDDLLALAGLELRAVVTGALERTHWVTLDALMLPTFVLSDDPAGSAPRVRAGITLREMASVQARLERMEHGWPLLGGRFVAELVAYGPDGAPASASEEDAVLAAALTELLAEAAKATVEAPDPVADRATFRRTFELGDRAFEVSLELTNPDAEGAQDEEAHRHGETEPDAGDEGSHDEGSHDEDLDEENLDDEDFDDEDFDDDDFDDDDFDDFDDDDFDEPPLGLEVAREAFEDFALERGHAVSAVRTAIGLFESAGVTDASSVPWPTPSQLSRYLARPEAQRRIAREGVEEVRAALQALCEWLAAVGYPEAEAHEQVIDRFRATPATTAATGATAAEAPLRPRWQPAPGEAVPALTDPCPCGSGRRYKKCCRKR